MYYTQVADLLSNGYILHYNKAAEYGNIQAELYPPTTAKLLFFGCGPVDKDYLDVGILVEPEVLFDQRSYPYGMAGLAKDTGRNVFTYFSSAIDNPIGFSMDQNIYLATADCYDCQQNGGWLAPPTQLDHHRLSADTTGIIELVLSKF